MLPFARLTIIGLGLIGSSVARAVKAQMPSVRITGHDADPAVRERVVALGICDDVTDTSGASVMDANLVILCVPVGAMGTVAAEFAADLPVDAIVSDVGSCKQSVAEALGAALPNAIIIPAHPVAGTEKSGPDAGFSTLFKGRWCILTPPEMHQRPLLNTCAFFGSSLAPMSKLWTRATMIWFLPSPAICRT